MSAAERVGRDIWFFATAFNDRFYTYSYPQRLGGGIDWFRMLSARRKGDLFQGWGAIPDPDCCVPGDPDCPKKSLEETYGFQYCPGDDRLLEFVGKEGYRDPACDLQDAPFDSSTPHGATDQRQSSCDLKFGTSTGALGLRKFPNPRFDAVKWRKLNGSLGTWDGYRSFLSNDPREADSRNNRLYDGSVEPPFRVGMACGACHIAYDPLKPPADPSNPSWDNIDGLIGNQYSRISQIMASGMSPHMLEWQLIARARPGTVDTSALPMDTISNPGTMNTIYNFARRPVHEHQVLKWRKASTCPEGRNASCWCEPAKPGKCWLRGEQIERVQNILKGGEDTIGAAEALQRVYLNIGSCGEQCWINHIPDLRATDPAQRNYGQTPVDIGQCRRDCAAFRAVEDRLSDLVAFLLTARPADLYKARGLPDLQALDAQLEQEFGAGAISLGREVFAKRCANCHSSQSGPYDTVDFRAVDPKDATLRLDFLSSDRPVLASRVGTYLGRAMHSNHMPSRVWEQYAALDVRKRPPDPALKEIMIGSGRGYYRPPSLLGVWASAPLMHNNAIGPEVCGKPADKSVDFYSPPYVDANDRPIADQPNCLPFDTSVEGRYRLFKASIEQLLYPERRGRKVNLVDEDVVADIAPKIVFGNLQTGFSVKLPKGSPAILINSLRFKDLLQDIVLLRRSPAKLDAKYEAILGADRLRELKGGLRQLDGLMSVSGNQYILDLTGLSASFIQRFYSNVLGRVENAGHTFGADLPDREKQALTAFLATL